MPKSQSQKDNAKLIQIIAELYRNEALAFLEVNSSGDGFLIVHSSGLTIEPYRVIQICKYNACGKEYSFPAYDKAKKKIEELKEIERERVISSF